MAIVGDIPHFQLHIISIIDEILFNPIFSWRNPMKIPCLMDKKKTIFEPWNPYEKLMLFLEMSLKSQIEIPRSFVGFCSQHLPNISPGGSTAARTVSAFYAATFASSFAAWPGDGETDRNSPRQGPI